MFGAQISVPGAENLPSYQKSLPERKLSSRKVSTTIFSKHPSPLWDPLEGKDPLLSHKMMINNVDIKDQKKDMTPSREEDAKPLSVLHPLHCYYENEQLFEEELSVFNMEMESYQGMAGSSNFARKWEYKGEERAAFQLCVSCRDVVKVRCHTE